jgi:hypothetical protein
MAAPLALAPLHVILAPPSMRLALTAVGAVGAPAGVTLELTDESADIPMALIALTRKV